MFSFWFIHIVGFFYLGMVSCDETRPTLMSIEPPASNDVVKIDLSINDAPLSAAEGTTLTSSTVSTSTQTPEAFACYQCTNCTSKSDFVTQTCESDITMCYIMQKRIDNTTQTTHRGCASSKTQCVVPSNDEPNPFISVTCCTTHKCNQAIQFQPLFFLSFLSFFIKIVSCY